MSGDTLFMAAAIPAVILMGLSKGGFSGLSLLSMPLISLVVSPVRAAAILLPISPRMCRNRWCGWRSG